MALFGEAIISGTCSVRGISFTGWYISKPAYVSVQYQGELISGTERPEGQTEEVKYVYKFHNDNQGNWKIRIKYIDDVPVVYEEREYTYY